MSRLTLLHINIIGAVVAIIVGLGLYFTLVTGAQDDKQKADTAYAGVKARADKATVAANNLKKANADAALAKSQYAVYEAVYMPTIGIIGGPNGRMLTMIRDFWPNHGRSWPERFRRTIFNYMAQERKRNGIVWENPGVIALPPYGPNPNDIDAGSQGDQLGPILHYRYDMQVRGTSMPALMNHIRSWPRITGAGVPVVDSVVITGNSPNLTMTYTLALTIIERESEAKLIPAPDPRVGGESGGAGGGFGGGGFGGMMGPMGMMGGARGRGGVSAMGPMGMGGGMMSGGMMGR